MHSKQHDFSTRITSLHGSQTSPVVLSHAKQRDPSIRNTSLYGSLPSSVVFYMPKQRLISFQNYKSLLVPHLTYGFLHSKQRLIRTRITSLYCISTPHLWIFAFKTAPLAPELQVTMGPRLSLCGFVALTTAALCTRIT